MSFFTRQRWILLLAALMVIAIPGISYAQLDVRGRAIETLTNGVMKELDKKFTEMVAKEALSAAVKARIVKDLSEMSRPMVKNFIDGAASGRLPNVTQVVNSVMTDITPRAKELVTASLKEEMTGSLTQAVGGQSPTAAGALSDMTPSGQNTSTPAVNIADIQGVAFPFIGSTPVTEITETAQYMGTITWSPAVSGTFALNTKYTATITLTPKTGYSFERVAANFFKVSGAESVSNNAGSGVITAVFPATMTVSIPSISGVKVPVTGAHPVKTIPENLQYKGTVTWSPEVLGPFVVDTKYTATITLTPKNGYTLEGIGDNFFSVLGAETVSNNANAGVIIAEFPPTKEIKTIHQEDKKLWSIGASVGSSFAAPLIIGTVHGTLAPFNSLFIDIGADAGYGIRSDDVDYYSLYPFVNFALFVPFPRLSTGKRGGWYAGAGFGAMIASYTFETAGKIGNTTFAMNIVTGFNLFNMIDLSYTVRTDFKSVNNKLSVGYVYRFN